MSLLGRGTAGSLMAFALLIPAGPAAGAGKAGDNPGKAIYDRDCASCHGATGKGDGEEAMYLVPPPQDFTNGSLAKRTDEFLTEVISQGGAAKGLSNSMPPAPKLTKADLKNVVAYIRQLAKAAPAKKAN
jgi:mono/diheme cytochrome c family protein